MTSPKAAIARKARRCGCGSRPLRISRIGRGAAQVPHLPRAADQAELTQLIGLMQSPIANIALAGVATPLTALDRAARERYLRGWATSRLPAKRKAFQALKRLTTVAYYTAVDARG